MQGTAFRRPGAAVLQPRHLRSREAASAADSSPEIRSRGVPAGPGRSHLENFERRIEPGRLGHGIRKEFNLSACRVPVLDPVDLHHAGHLPVSLTHGGPGEINQKFDPNLQLEALEGCIECLGFVNGLGLSRRPKLN